MDLRHLETFAKIAELKSFTKAAEELYLTQPTVSKQVVDLERYFDVKLIDRTKRSVTVTRAGEILFQYAKEFLYLRKEAIDAMAAFKGLRKGTLLVGASSIPGIYVLPRVVHMFRKQYSGIQVKVLISDTQDVIEKMEDDRIDIGFVGAKGETKKLEYKRFLDDTIVLVAPPGYSGSISIENLKDYPLIVREAGSGTRNNFESALKKVHMDAAKDLNVVAELTDTEAIKEAVKSGMGISYMSKMAIDGELARNTLKVLHVEGMRDPKRFFYIVTKKGRTILPHVKALLETIERWKKETQEDHSVDM